MTHGRLGPLVRVALDGVSTAVWTGGLVLTVAGAGSDWSTTPSPAQERVQGAEAEPVVFVGGLVLARVDCDGRVQKVFTDAPVRGARTGGEAPWVVVDVEPWSLRSLGIQIDEVLWSSRWIPLPWTGDAQRGARRMVGAPPLMGAVQLAKLTAAVAATKTCGDDNGSSQS